MKEDLISDYNEEPPTVRWGVLGFGIEKQNEQKIEFNLFVLTKLRFFKKIFKIL
jgi:hypothetical protein